VWKKASIFDAIMVFTYKMRNNFTSLWDVLPCWSHETCTFNFPSQEATITSEDVMILEGFSPIRLCARGVEPLTGELEEFNLHLVRAHKSFNKTKVKKACFSAWMSHFLGCNDSSIEQIAFLSLWLSKYIFLEAPSEVWKKKLFPIAMLLAQGECFALELEIVTVTCGC